MGWKGRQQKNTDRVQFADKGGVRAGKSENRVLGVRRERGRLRKRGS